MARSLQASLFLVLLTACGCSGGSTHPPTATVSGTVTLDGQPLENATLMFQPESGRPSTGVTDKEGRYTLEYMAGVPGATLGMHFVIIRTLVAGEDGRPPVSPEKLPKKYHDETGLRVEVKSGANTHDFDLSSKP